MNHNIVMKMFAALGQDSRLSIYQRVVQAGEAGLSAGKIGEHLAIAQTTLSFHLKELVHSGLLQSRQHGKFVIYTANPAARQAVIAFLSGLDVATPPDNSV